MSVLWAAFTLGVIVGVLGTVLILSLCLAGDSRRD
jgi:hypothetical protein